MEVNGFILIALGILGFGLVSARLQTTPITPPIVFVALGAVVGPGLLGLIDVNLHSTWFDLLAELTLILVLFTDASRIDLRALRSEHDLPVRLLALGLPLTIALGTLLAMVILGSPGVWEAAALAVVLAPTDAALGQAVVSSPRVPVRIRQALNVESGLNDGMVLPVLLIVLSCAGAAAGAGHQESLGYWVRFTALQVLLGPLVGVAVGYFGGRAVSWATRGGWMDGSFQRLSALGLALLAYGAALALGGNGFIAAFCAGLTLGNSSRAICECLYEFAEAEGQLLTLLVFLVFGVTLAPVVFEHADARTLLYAVSSLTVVRMVPVALALIGKRLKLETVVFLGWFGPRGIASLLFLLLIVEEMVLVSEDQVLLVVATTVLLSILAHGLTAYPASVWYSRRMKRYGDAAGEHAAVGEMPVRARHI